MAATRSSKLSNLYVPRVVSFIVLLAIILLVGIVFFQVMAQFIVPLFLACVLLVIFQPLHRWFLGKLPKWPRVAALLTTITIMLTVLVPTIYLGWNAYDECERRIEVVQQKSESKSKSELLTQASDASENTLYARLISKGDEWAATLKEKTGLTLKKKPAELLSDAVNWVGGLLPLVAGAAIRILVGLLIMIVALYYFLADGPAMINGLMGLSPMDKRHELELLARFAEISRSVVLATLLSAVAQGILAGIGFYFALPSGAPIFLLVALTMVLAIVPFIGAAGVWVFVCGIIFMFGPDVFVVGGEATDAGNWPVALGLALYCAIVVSGIDNVIKPLVLHGQANLHPLLALLSILGGVQVLGPVGILVGPMLVSFLQALLAMFRKELERWEDPTQRSLTLSPGAQALAEQIEAAVEAAEDEKSDAPKDNKSAGARKNKGR